MADQTTTRNVKIRITGEDAGASQVLDRVASKAESARRKIDGASGGGAGGGGGDRLSQWRAATGSVESSWQRARRLEQADRESQDRASWQQSRDRRAQELRSQRESGRFAMMEEFRRASMYGSPADGYGGGMSLTGGGRGTGGAGAGAGDRSGRKAMGMIARAGIAAGGLPGQLGGVAGFAMEAGALAGPVAAAVLLGQTIATVADHNKALVGYQKQYNAELAESARRWRDMAAGQLGNTDAGGSFRQMSAEAMSRMAGKKAKIEEEQSQLGLIDSLGVAAGDLMGGSAYKKRIRLMVQGGLADKASAERLRAAADVQEGVNRRRQEEDRWTELGGLRGNMRDPQERAMAELADERDARKRKAEREHEDRVAIYDVAYREQVANTKGGETLEMRNKRTKDLKQIDEDNRKEQEQADAVYLSKRYDAQEKYNRETLEREQAHGRKMLDMKGENEVAKLQLAGYYHEANLKEIDSSFEKEIREIAANAQKERDVTNDARRRAEIDKEEADAKEQARQKRDNAKTAADRQKAFERRDIELGFSQNIRNIREGLAARAMRLNGQNDEADRYTIQANLRSRLQELATQKEQELRNKKGDENEINARYAQLAQGAISEAGMSQAELEQRQRRQFSPFENFAVASGDQRVLSGAVRPGANMADNTKAAADWTKKVAGIEEKTYDLIKNELIPALLGKVQPQVAGPVP